ncbi:MAG: V-type ATP synthase subunit E [Planctomycetes bacterium]|nr:V-type ATP synthase subunit E [Planctomycetota bacterium]
MGAEEVVGKILADAKAAAEKLRNEAAEKAAGEQAKLDEQLAEYRKQTEVLAKKAGKEKKAHLLASARMEISKKYLAEKRRILDGIFAKARTQLQNLPDEAYRTLMAKLMLEAVEGGEEEVIVDIGEKRIDAALIEQVNSKLGDKGKLKLSKERAEIGAGFILRSDRIKTNVSMDILLSQTRKDSEIELAKDLFAK